MNKKDIQKNYYTRNKDRILAYQKEYYKIYKPRKKRKIYIADKATRNANRLKYTYKITDKDRENMFNNQDKKCLLCQKALTIDKVCIDHCHISKKVRGLLCNHCNLALGFFKDNNDTLKRAIKYLES